MDMHDPMWMKVFRGVHITEGFTSFVSPIPYQRLAARLKPHPFKPETQSEVPWKPVLLKGYAAAWVLTVREVL